MNRESEAFLFFVGIIIGVMGNFLVSTMVEMVNRLWQRIPYFDTLPYWAGLFIAASLIFFQLSKMAMRRLGIQHGLGAFDWACVFCTILGIIAIVVAFSTHYIQWI
jgi:hypothetical protein